MRALAFVCFSPLLCSCRPELPTPSGTSSPPLGSAAISLTTTPPSPAGSIASIAQIRVHPAPSAALDATTAALVLGPVSDVALRGYRDGSPPASTTTRAVSAQIWADSGDVVIAPSTILDAGQTYTVVLGSVMATLSLTCVADSVPVLARFWPPLGSSSSATSAVWCGDGPLPASIAWTGELPPTTSLDVQTGVLDDFRESTCVTATASGASAWPIPAALVEGARVVARLDPTPLAIGNPPAPTTPVSCIGSEIALATTCATLDDDRLHLRAPPPPLLFSVDIDTAHTTFVSTSQSFTVRGLTPSAMQHVHIRIRDLTDHIDEGDADVTTLPPRSHVVINEVLTYPLGSLASSQWIELYNDGTIEADLTDFSIDDGITTTTLPTSVLPPASFALLVRVGFAPNGLDVAPAPQSFLVPVAHLGKTALAERGAVLTLRDPSGAILSRAPATPEPTRGVSVCRVRPDAADDDPAGFVLAPNGTPTPGAPNGIDLR